MDTTFFHNKFYYFEEVDLIVSDNFTIAEVVDCKYFLMVVLHVLQCENIWD